MDGKLKDILDRMQFLHRDKREPEQPAQGEPSFGISFGDLRDGLDKLRACSSPRVAALLSSRLTSPNWQKVKCAILNGSSYRPFLLAKARRSGILNAVNANNLLSSVTFPCDGLVNTEGVFEHVKSVSVFPNPTNEDVFVQFNLIKNNAVTLSVLNTMGQIVAQKMVTGSVGLNEYPLSIKGENGVYLIQIKVENEVITRKIVKFE